MDNYHDLRAMRKNVSKELVDWKTLMKDLAGAFYKQFPAIKKYGWTLHLRYCAKSKGCAMCPHSIIWARYYHVNLHEETKLHLIQAGEKAPKSKISWDNSKYGTDEDNLPKRLMVSKKDRATHKEFEAVRATIMGQHQALSSLHRRLLALERHRKPDALIGFFDASIGKDYLTIMLPSRPIKIEVIRKIEDLRTR